MTDDPLTTESIDTAGQGVAFAEAKRLADEAAHARLDQPICLSWFDRGAERESPAHASECHDDCDIPGYIDYAINRGAELKVVVDDGAYVFCYRPLGEFGDV